MIVSWCHSSVIFVFLTDNFHEGTDVISKQAEVQIVNIQYFLQDVRLHVSQESLVVQSCPVGLRPTVQMVDLSQVSSSDLKYCDGDGDHYGSDVDSGALEVPDPDEDINMP